MQAQVWCESTFKKGTIIRYEPGHFSKRKYSRETLYRSLLSDISESFYRNNCGGTYSFYLHIQK